jgi:hypothetical protein
MANIIIIDDLTPSLTQMDDGITIGAVSISDQVVRCFVPRESIGGLTGNPLRCRIGRYRK